MEGSTSLARKSSFRAELEASVDTSREVSAVGASSGLVTSGAVVGQATVANVGSFESSSQQQQR